MNRRLILIQLDLLMDAMQCVANDSEEREICDRAVKTAKARIAELGYPVPDQLADVLSEKHALQIELYGRISPRSYYW